MARTVSPRSRLWPTLLTGAGMVLLVLALPGPARSRPLANDKSVDNPKADTPKPNLQPAGGGAAHQGNIGKSELDQLKEIVRQRIEKRKQSKTESAEDAKADSDLVEKLVELLDFASELDERAPSSSPARALRAVTKHTETWSYQFLVGSPAAGKRTVKQLQDDVGNLSKALRTKRQELDQADTKRVTLERKVHDLSVRLDDCFQAIATKKALLEGAELKGRDETARNLKQEVNRFKKEATDLLSQIDSAASEWSTEAQKVFDQKITLGRMEHDLALAQMYCDMLRAAMGDDDSRSASR